MIRIPGFEAEFAVTQLHSSGLHLNGVVASRSSVLLFPLIKYLEKYFLLPSGGAFEIFQE